MTPQRFRRILWLSLAVPSCLVFLMAATVAVEVRQLRESLDWVDHTDTVIAETRGTLRRIMDAESARRGYQLTGDAVFLQAWQQTRANELQFARLREMVQDNTEQQQRLATALGLYQQWRVQAQELIRRHQSGENILPATNLEEQKAMDGIRSIIGDIIHAEEGLRAARIERAGRIRRDFNWSLAVLSLALASTLVLFSRFQLHGLAAQYVEALNRAEHQAVLERERKQWFFTLLRSVADAVIATDAQGRITFLNPAAEQSTGWSEEQAQGRPLGEVFRLVDAGTGRPLEDLLCQVSAGHIGGVPSHSSLLRRDGSTIRIDDSGAPIRDEHGAILGIILIFRDVTQQVEMERVLRTTERLALAGRITASVAHEIYNPLDTVVNLLFLIQSASAEASTQEYAALASRELLRVNQVTRGLLSLYRESHSPVLVRLEEVIAEVLALLEMEIRHKQAEVVCQGIKGLEAEGFPAELRQVFTNLVHNALDALPRGGRVEIQGSEVGEGLIELSVCDNGSGISPADMARLFQPMFTTKGVDGTGLGLWVSKGILEKHGGDISVRSSVSPESSGSTFTVHLRRHFPATVMNNERASA